MAIMHPKFVFKFNTLSEEKLYYAFKNQLPDNYEVSDKAGNVVKNLRNLNYGETYTVSWFEGTKYKEHQLVANCSFYKQPENTKEYVLKGKLNKEGYASYDYSEIPPGLYRVMGGNGADIWSVIKVGE